MGLKDKLQDLFEWLVSHTFGNMIDLLMGPAVKYMETMVAGGTLHTEDIQTPELKEKMDKFKEKWSHSPSNMSDIANDVLDIVKGQLAKLQFEAIAGVTVDDKSPVAKKAFDNIGAVTDTVFFSNFLGILGEIVPTTQLGRIGDEIRQYLNYSGVSQIVGYGYGNMLNTLVSPMIQQELNAKKPIQLCPPDVLTALRIRNEITDEFYNTQMSKHGFDKNATNRLYTASQYYPGAQDFIRFAVRDTFNSAIVGKYGYDQNFPTDILRYSQKAGVKDEWMKHYWRAHWELPSPTAGYEMLHRGVISQDELKTLLQISDMAPWWIPKMIDISYSPLTRVDARRMYEEGVLDDTGYLKALKDVGYNDEHANMLLEWTKRRKQAPEKDLTKAVILNAYELGLNTKSDTVAYIQRLGYDSAEADLIVSIKERQIQQAQINDQLDTLRFKFAKGVLSMAEFKAGVQALGLPKIKSDLEIVRGQQDKDKMLKLPSKEDLGKWRKAGIITNDTYKVRMAQLGYMPDDIELYLKAG